MIVPQGAVNAVRLVEDPDKWPARGHRRHAEGAVAAPRVTMAPWHFRVSKAPSAVTLAISWSGGIWSGSSGSMDASPTSLVVNSAIRISIFSSIPMCIDPHMRLAATLTAIIQGDKQNRIDDLLPWSYAANL